MYSLYSLGFFQLPDDVFNSTCKPNTSRTASFKGNERLIEGPRNYYVPSTHAERRILFLTSDALESILGKSYQFFATTLEVSSARRG